VQSRGRLTLATAIGGLADARRINGSVNLAFTEIMDLDACEQNRDELERILKEPVSLVEMPALKEGLALGAEVIWE
jgi:hypothetical protein